MICIAKKQVCSSRTKKPVNQDFVGNNTEMKHRKSASQSCFCDSQVPSPFLIAAGEASFAHDHLIVTHGRADG